ncbi:MAG: ankyrin repeat domain-containing protein, partial [Spirochaetota bacterium]|nr:ankyrin repeat domain-containing protein [Spirochaetota bacterium]
MKLIYILILTAIPILISCGTSSDELHHAIVSGDIDKASSLIEKGDDINTISDDPQFEKASPMQLALINRRDKLAKLLINSGADVHYSDGENGITALHITVLTENIPLMDALIEKGARVNETVKIKEAPGYTSLHLAVRSGMVTVTGKLLKGGANINIKNADGETPLHIAVVTGKLPLIERLIVGGADINATDKRGFTPLHLATKLGRLQIIKMILAKNPDLS